MRIIYKWGVVVGCALITWVAGYHGARASGLTITASYNGTVQKNGQFKNTTPKSGVCVDRPTLCPKDSFSILFPWPGNSSKRLGVATVTYGGASIYHSDESISVAFSNANRKITVDNGHGSTGKVNFSVDAIALYNSPSINKTYFDPGGYLNPYGDNCQASRSHQETGGVYVVWQGAGRSSNVLCWAVPPKITPPTRITVGDVSFRYKLSLDKPWTWTPGIYRGSYLYHYGDGGDIYLGPNFVGSTDDVMMNFVLTVQPDIYVNFPTAQGGVTDAELIPIGGWSSWQDRMPPLLSVDVPFDFGSIGPVKIHLQCQHLVGDTCGIADLKDGGPLGIDALLTDSKFKDDSGKPANYTRLSTLDRAFSPLSDGKFGITSARLTFRTQQGVVKQMQAGHQYGGRVTIVFNSALTD